MKNQYFKKLRPVVYVLLFAGLAITSCQESSTNIFDQGSDISTMSVNQQNAFKGKKGTPPGLIPNSKKYADNSLPSASGRDGEVMVTSRALIDAEGNVDLEVTTGELDSDETAPGTITKLQVKALDTDSPDKDNPLWTENYNKLSDGGAFTTSYNGLERGQELYVHANVKGIKKKGTAVVFMNETIKARPDISVIDISSDAEVLTGVPVIITAGLAELNGDLGARTSCVLYIDGVKIDGANNAWVDAGDVVGCQFETTFTETGQKNIVVAAEEVTPGDYDLSNNSAYTTISVIEPSTGFGDNSFNWYSSVFGRYTNYSSSMFDMVSGNESINYSISTSGNKQVSSPLSQNSYDASFRFSTSGETILEGTVPVIFQQHFMGIRVYDYKEDSATFGAGSPLFISAYSWGNNLQVSMSLTYYKTVYYGSNPWQGDYHTVNESGYEFEFGDEVSFELLIDGHTLSSSVAVSSNTTYSSGSSFSNTVTTYSGSASGQPE